VQPLVHQLGQGGLETEGGGPPSRGRPTSQGCSHSTNRMKTYLYKYNIRCNPQRRHGSAYLREVEEVEGEVEDGIEGEVEDTHAPFKHSKERLKMQ